MIGLKINQKLVVRFHDVVSNVLSVVGEEVGHFTSGGASNAVLWFLHVCVVSYK